MVSASDFMQGSPPYAVREYSRVNGLRFFHIIGRYPSLVELVLEAPEFVVPQLGSGICLRARIQKMSARGDLSCWGSFTSDDSKQAGKSQQACRDLHVHTLRNGVLWRVFRPVCEWSWFRTRTETRTLMIYQIDCSPETDGDIYGCTCWRLCMLSLVRAP